MTSPIPVLCLADGESRELPWQWAICSTCQGRGHHSLRLGAITQDQRADWDDDEWADYIAGAYDEPCGCDAGKVRVPDTGRMSPEDVAAWEAQCREDEEFSSQQRAEMGWEANYW